MAEEVTVAYVRSLGKLPAILPDDAIAPHLESARRHVSGLLGGAAPASDDDAARVNEAIACFAIAYALPGLNTFFLAHADQVPRYVAETDYVFNDPAQVKVLADLWEKRAANALRDVGRTTGAVGAAVI